MSSLLRVFLYPWVHIVQWGDGMSYRVEYDSGIKWEQSRKSGRKNLWVWTGICFAVFVLLVNLFWDAGREVLLQLILPGDARASWNGVLQLSDNLRQGIPLQAAVRDFCYEILQGCY